MIVEVCPKYNILYENVLKPEGLCVYLCHEKIKTLVATRVQKKKRWKYRIQQKVLKHV